ncbi:ADP-ribose pyrophosphatase YjhB [Entamoeba marina]
MNTTKPHPFEAFKFCPKCGKEFLIDTFKSKKCASCGFVYFYNSAAAVAVFIKNSFDQILVVRRANNPAKGTLDLPGGFVDFGETVEESAKREIEEETKLQIAHMKYLFSLPNQYEYSGFVVNTTDMFFEAKVDTFNHAIAGDDASEIIILNAKELNPDLFGLSSIRKAVTKYIE